MRRLGRLFWWCLVVYALITTFGETTGPLLLVFVADGIVGLLLFSSCMKMRGAMVSQHESGNGGD